MLRYLNQLTSFLKQREPFFYIHFNNFPQKKKLEKKICIKNNKNANKKLHIPVIARPLLKFKEKLVRFSAFKITRPWFYPFDLRTILFMKNWLELKLINPEVYTGQQAYVSFRRNSKFYLALCIIDLKRSFAAN